MNIGMIYSSLKYITKIEIVTKLSCYIYEFFTSNNLLFDNETIKHKFTRSVIKLDIITATYLIKYIDEKYFLGPFLSKLKNGNIKLIYQFTKLFIDKGINIGQYGSELFENFCNARLYYGIRLLLDNGITTANICIQCRSACEKLIKDKLFAPRNKFEREILEIIKQCIVNENNFVYLL